MGGEAIGDGLPWGGVLDPLPAPPQTLDLHVSEVDQGRRLDAFVARKLHWRSRTALVRLIEEGRARINGHRAKKSQRLGSGDHVTLEVSAAPEAQVDLGAVGLELLFEDEDLVVVDKPPHLAVHPASTCMQLNLLRRLEYRYAHEAPDSQAQPSVVHRLDRVTSGVIVFARRRELVAFYTQQFERRSVRKEYQAIVHGELVDAGEFRDPLLARPEQAVVVSDLGKQAHTSYSVVRRSRDYSHVRIALHTGRKHQIRVHFSAAGYPLVHDDLYGRVHERDTWPADAAVLLHSSLLELEHRVHGRMCFESAQPQRLLEFWHAHAEG